MAHLSRSTSLFLRTATLSQWNYIEHTVQERCFWSRRQYLTNDVDGIDYYYCDHNRTGACYVASSMSSYFYSRTPCVRIEDEADSTSLSTQGTTSFVKNKDGLELCRYFWPVANPLGIVFGVHGVGTHVGSFLLKRDRPHETPNYKDSVVEKLNQQHFSVAAIDLQGHGRSEGWHGTRIFFYQFSDLVEDVLDFIQSVLGNQQGFPDSLPIFLLGASMGGCIVTHVAYQLQQKVTGVVLISAMLSVEKLRNEGINWIFAYFAEWLNYLVPDVPLIPVKRVEIHPKVLEIFDADPSIYKGRITPRSGYQCLKAIEWVEANQKDFKFPFLAIHGMNDTLCDPEGSKTFFEKSQVSDKTLHLAENMWHMLFSEPGHEKLINLMLQWIKERSTPQNSQVSSDDG